ncbi:hypothetical protein [Pseudonocardia sp.]|uniref:hypothetical protein n=1 Tax=Pseudonocardia sp. TaxID=60912 RepID=UPI002622FBA8|nr:hypothetical protein [Pseudonocardia sp.]
MNADPEFGDRALLDELAALLRGRNEPPPEVLDAAREVFTWRTVDAEIAALTYDSLLDDVAVAVRAAAQPRILTFESDGLTVEVELDATPSGRRLLGQLIPAQAAELELRSAETVVGSSVADDLGRFAVPVPSGTARVWLRCRLADGTVVETASAAM